MAKVSGAVMPVTVLMWPVACMLYRWMCCLRGTRCTLAHLTRQPNGSHRLGELVLQQAIWNFALGCIDKQSHSKEASFDWGMSRSNPSVIYQLHFMKHELFKQGKLDVNALSILCKESSKTQLGSVNAGMTIGLKMEQSQIGSWTWSLLVRFWKHLADISCKMLYAICADDLCYGLSHRDHGSHSYVCCKKGSIELELLSCICMQVDRQRLPMQASPKAASFM